ncbi:hypothetical protein LINPERPRIM_LOCUS40980 [Linum perenne]
MCCKTALLPLPHREIYSETGALFVVRGHVLVALARPQRPCVQQQAHHC